MIPVFNIARGLWEIKPNPWGNQSDVAANLKDRLERIGIAYEDVTYASPLWSAHEYSKNKNTGTVNAGSFVRDGFVPGSHAQPMALDNTISLLSTKDFTIYIDMKTPANFISNGMILGANDVDNYLHVRAASNEFIIQNNANINLTQPYTWASDTNYKIACTYYRTGHETYPNDIEFFVNSDSIGIAAGSKTTSPRFKIDTIGNGYTSFFGFVGIIRQVIIFENTINPTQIAILSDNPYQLWQPPEYRYYSFGAAAVPTFNPGWATQCNNLLSGGMRYV